MIRCLLCASLLFSALPWLAGCSSSDGSSSDGAAAHDAGQSGTAPAITAIVFKRQQDNVRTVSLPVGVVFYWSIDATDPDLDMSSMVVTYYDPSKTQVGMNGVWQNPITLETQTAADATFTSNVWYFAAADPKGIYTLKAQITDSKGNKSPESEAYIEYTD